MSLLLFCWFQKDFWYNPTWQALDMPPAIRCATSFTTWCKSHVHRNIHISNKWHHTWWNNIRISVKQGCFISLTLFSTYNDELQTYLDAINKDSLCLFDKMVANHLYDNNVVVPSKFGATLQWLWKSYMSFALLLALQFIYQSLKFINFGWNKRKLYPRQGPDWGES